MRSAGQTREPGASYPAPSAPPPVRHTHRLRVRYAECDPMRVAHHGSYAAWLEEARTEMLRTSGVSYAAMEDAGQFLVITRLEIKYRRPIRYDDLIDVRVHAEALGRTRLRHTYELVIVERAGAAPQPGIDPTIPVDGVCAVATTELACVDASGRPGAMPLWLLGQEAGA